MKTPLYLIDGYALIFRSYFAFIRTPLTTSGGVNISALHGFTRILLNILRDYSPEYLAVALDSRTPTFRDEMFEDYKKTRDKTPEDLKAQFPIIETLLKEFHIPTVRRNGMEADDIIASLARSCSAEGRPCFIVSGDKDLYQLVDEHVRILKPSRSGGFEELDGEGVFQDKGVHPDQIIDYLALLGDSADNVPGVKGIGQKTAEKLLGQYESLDGIYDHLEDIQSANWKKKLSEGRESAFLSKKLVILKDDLDFEFTLDDLTLESLDGGSAAELLKKYEIQNLSKEIQKVNGSSPGKESPFYGMGEIGGPEMDPGGGMLEEDLSSGSPGPGDQAPADGMDKEAREKREALNARIGDMEQDFSSLEARYELVTDAEGLRNWVDRCMNAGEYAFDTETDSLDALDAQLCGFSLSCTPGEACYVPLRSPGNTPHLDESTALSILKPLLENPEYRLAGQNIKYDYCIMARRDVVMANPWFDTMIAAWLIDTTANSYGMDALAEQYLGYTTGKLIPLYEEITGEKVTKARANSIDFARIPLDRALDYAAEDADITLRLSRILGLYLERADLNPGAKQTALFHDLEMPLVPVLGDMEMRGIMLDTPALRKYSTELEEQLEEITGDIYEMVGHEFNIASTKQLQEVLFQERKLTPVKKTKTGYSTDTSVLEQLSKEDKVPELVLRHRTLSKLKSTYVDSLPLLIHEESGRLHSRFQQNGTATGRLSSHDPNLQNIPIRDEEGRKIREAFVPRDGCMFISADYSQIELVVLAHLSRDPGLVKAYNEGTDVHSLTASQIFQVKVDDVSSMQRRIAKSINFGVMYGMSAFRLSREIGISRNEAQEFIDAYFQTYSGIRRYIDDLVERTEKLGYVETMAGRRRSIPTISSSNKNERMGAQRIAVNTPIQGSAADIVKTAMLKVDAELKKQNLQTRLLLQVHDELIFEVPENELDGVEELLGRIMPGAVELSVPLSVNIERGASWGEMH
ncbi:DNA polymerase I [Salinispira pacifica]|uniref:DNA polymerase I n=1 Tax=Salinispira pacifica TaxID=1307761 RepID=V5WDN6_9SPIO|nr:DNA polymerase I [Salinispira pacifica]AHC13730.1 DNA polymerase I [Salinispira pacifica]